MLDPLVRPIVFPLLAGLVCAVLPDRPGSRKVWERVRAWLTIVASAASIRWVWPLYAGPLNDGQPLSSAGGWLRADVLSGFILLATVFFSLMIAIYSHRYMAGRAGQRLYYSSLLWSLGLACGVLLANDVLLLAVCWGPLAVTLYLMIGLSGGGASEAARKTLILVGGTDALLLLGAALMWIERGSTSLVGEPLDLNESSNYLAFLCFVAAAFAKAAAMPLHTWLPDSAEKADAPVTALLPASIDKLLGIYLLVRIATDWFRTTPGTDFLLMLLGAVTIIGAVLMALVQHDLKRLLGMHAVSQVGYMVLAIGTGTTLGIAAGLFHMLNHAIYKSCLFLGAGVVEQKTGTVNMDRLGGLASRMPVVFAATLIASLSISGIPPLNGFASKWMVYQAIIESGQSSGTLWWCLWLTAAMLGSALTLASFVKMLHSVFLCKPSPEIRQRVIERATWPLVFPMVMLAGLCVGLGVFGRATALPYFIEPAVGQSLAYSGTWLPAHASMLMVTALVLGWLVYAMSFRGGRFRRVPTYIGGENIDETRIPGIPWGTSRHVEVTGVDFYQTVEQLPGLGKLYSMARAKVFDLYEVIGKLINPLAGALRAAHQGVLPLYLGWFLFGLLAILYVMMERSP